MFGTSVKVRVGQPQKSARYGSICVMCGETVAISSVEHGLLHAAENHVCNEYRTAHPSQKRARSLFSIFG